VNRPLGQQLAGFEVQAQVVRLISLRPVTVSS